MKGIAIKRDQLSNRDRERMFLLLQKHFNGVEREVFNSDLNDKNWVILIEKDGGHLAGFSTILQYPTTYGDEKLSVIYSGDTIVDRCAWGSLSLPKIWIKTVKYICEQGESGRVVWLLLTSGYRTYRFLPVFWNQFYPRHDKETPFDVQDLIDHLAQERFGKNFYRDTGIVRFDKPQSLSDELRVVPQGKLSDPHVAHFNKLNPGHNLGDELVCFAELNDHNLSPAGRRMVTASHPKKKSA